MKNEIHIVHQDDEWKVKRTGNERSSGNFNRKEEAIEYGKILSKNSESELVIHNMNGRISNKNSYGNDPFPPRDKR